ncbi:MAG: tetratricopeptide repeat protein [Burkholderiales bacterium]|nr:tetratricopeptide repeat protein [Phycisphaerae bacterium]
MKVRAKGVRRIAGLLIVLTLIGVAASIIGLRQRRSRNQALDAEKRVGMQAVLAGDFSKALDPLERYLRVRDADDQAAIAYATARYKIEIPNGQHLSKAVEKLDGVLKRDPENLQAKHLLLEIYPQTQNSETALEYIAEDVLSRNPADSLAIRGLITVRLRQNRVQEALNHARRYAEVRPEDLESRMLAMQLMKALKLPDADIKAYADEQFGRDATDPRFLLLHATAANFANDAPLQLQYLQQAAARPTNSPSLVRLLASLFDQLKRFDESRAILERAAGQNGDPEILRILITRLWQGGRDSEIVERLSSLDPAGAKTDVDLLAMNALAHYGLKRADVAEKIIENLRTRKDSPKARAWVAALEARFSSQGQTPLAVATKLSKEALARDPDNGIFRSWLGDTYWSLGEASLALHQWSAAAQTMPSWARPYVGMSQALLQLGRTAEAVDAAKEAYDRLPTTASAINLALVRYRLIDETSDQAGADELLKMVQQVQAAVPGEPNTLPMGVSLLAASGQREQAIAMLDAAIQSSRPLDVQTTLKLAAVSRAEGLEREELILSRVPDAQINPRLALTRATLLADAGKPADGLVLLKKHSKLPTDDPTEWPLAIAEYLDSIGSLEAPQTWRSLGDSSPGSLGVQRAILTRANCLRTDRAFIEKTITRLKEITGPDAQQWKVERARWLIESPDVMKDGVEAVTILTDVVRDSPRQIEPRLQLARALERTGNIGTAVEHLRAAQKIDPRSASVTLELVRVLQNQGSTDQVRDVLRQMSTTAMSTAHQRVLLASMFADVGDGERAIGLLEPDERRRALSPPGRLLLADLYRRAGKTAEAGKIYELLLAAKTPSTGVLAAAAEFYAMQGQMESARKVLATLASMDTQNCEAWIAQARFEDRFGNADSALALFRKAADSGMEQGYIALIDHLMEKKDFSQAIAVARAALQKLPGSNQISTRAREAEARTLHRADPKNLEPLITALSQDPTRVAEAEVLKALNTIRAGKLSPAESIARLRSVADRFPRLLPLQEQLVDQYLQQNKVDDAVLLAQRTMESLPTEPAAAALAVRTLRSARRFGEMRLAGEQWRQRSSGMTIDADTAIAEALIELRKPDEAHRQMEPYLAGIEKDVRTQPQAAVVLARIMLARKDGAGARKLLEPLMSESYGRRLCLGVASTADTMIEASAWLQQISGAISAENLDERLAISNTWAALARRFDDPQALRGIPGQLESYLQARPQDVDAWMLVAGIHQQLGQLEVAESELRAVLAIRPDYPPAANDLACLLLTRGANIKEAAALARSAVAQVPTSAAFQDTLARVHLAEQQPDAARNGFEQALRLNPELLDARIGLAQLLQQKGDNDAALRELQRVNVQIKANPAAGRHLESEIVALRQSLSGVDQH